MKLLFFLFYKYKRPFVENIETVIEIKVQSIKTTKLVYTVINEATFVFLQSTLQKQQLQQLGARIHLRHGRRRVQRRFPRGRCHRPESSSKFLFKVSMKLMFGFIILFFYLSSVTSMRTSSKIRSISNEVTVIFRHCYKHEFENLISKNICQTKF